MNLRVGIIDNSDTTARVDIEPNYRRIINRIFALVLSEGYRDIDIADFKSIMMKRLNTEHISTEDVLIAFDSLDANEQLEVIKQCNKEMPIIEVDSPLLVSLAIADSFEHQEYYMKPSGRYDNLTDSNLKRMIKYSRNPMEKKELQRVLSSRNFMNGKHSKGKRR